MKKNYTRISVSPNKPILVGASHHIVYLCFESPERCFYKVDGGQEKLNKNSELVLSLSGKQLKIVATPGTGHFIDLKFFNQQALNISVIA